MYYFLFKMLIKHRIIVLKKKLQPSEEKKIIATNTLITTVGKGSKQY